MVYSGGPWAQTHAGANHMPQPDLLVHFLSPSLEYTFNSKGGGGLRLHTGVLAFRVLAVAAATTYNRKMLVVAFGAAGGVVAWHTATLNPGGAVE